MRGIERLVRLGVDVAARRWPRDIADQLRHEWRAELVALRDDPGLSRSARAYRMIMFAGSLAVSPAVEAEGAEPVDRPPALLAPAVAAGVLLVAAAAFNVVHAVGYRSGAVAGFLLAAALLGMGALGYHVRGPAVTWTVSMGAAMFAFLMAGNAVAVMPFMGWRDVLPGVAVWTVTTVAAVRVARRHRVLGVLAGVAGLEVAAIAGSLHAASVVKAGLVTAPAWFPLALLPGGTASFGPYFADGRAAFGALHGSGPAFHASDILLGNVSAMVGPMLLCSAFGLAVAVRRAPFRVPVPRYDLHVPLGVGATVAVLVVAEWLDRASVDIGSALSRVVDNSNVFGFGFLAGMSGRIAVALVAGVLVGQLAVSRRARAAG